MTGLYSRAEAPAILSRNARSFAPAARVLARADRQRMALLCALCRTVDTLADADGSIATAGRQAALQAALRRPGLCAIRWRTLRAPFLPGGRLALARSQIRWRGCAMTLRVALTTVAALDAYARSVAGTVGVMMAVLFDVLPLCQGDAADLGRAMQLTNICRHVAEDASAGRRYLPATLFPWKPAQIAAQIAAPTAQVRTDVRHAVNMVLLQADVLNASGNCGLVALPRRVRLCVVVAAALYRGIADHLRARDCDPLPGRVFVPGARKLRLAIGAGVGLIRSPGAGWTAALHRTSRA